MVENKAGGPDTVKYESDRRVGSYYRRGLWEKSISNRPFQTKVYFTEVTELTSNLDSSNPNGKTLFVDFKIQ